MRALLLPVLLLSACAPQDAPAPATPAGVPAAWLGRWSGPEGTYLEIVAGQGTYTVTISNLDGPRTFAATPGAGSLGFERDGVHETVQATDGAGTGMKWLATRHDCLVVRPGEGFCRD